MGAEPVNNASGADLKRLAFVRSYSDYYFQKGYGLASSVYSTGKSYAPDRFHGSIAAVEQTVSEYGTPLVTAVQDKSDQVLHLVDSKVDTAVTSAYQFYEDKSSFLASQVEKQKKYHEKNLEHYKASRENYLKKIEESVDFLKKEGLTGSARYAADAVLARVDDAKKLPPMLVDEAKVVVSKVGDAWAYLASLPAVHKLLETAQPSLDLAWKKYLIAHDSLLSTPIYHQIARDSTAVVGKVQQTPIYKKITTTVYPIISPYADPALDTIYQSSYYSAVKDHLKPVEVNGAH
uniref:Oil globule protein n=1 Tax=Lobosphaera incisa TaxID=312850 RepID=A0A1X9QDR7_9CHLO|nr:oil globule protein [Lobosphaera incisa]